MQLLQSKKLRVSIQGHTHDVLPAVRAPGEQGGFNLLFDHDRAAAFLRSPLRAVDMRLFLCQKLRSIHQFQKVWSETAKEASSGRMRTANADSSEAHSRPLSVGDVTWAGSLVSCAAGLMCLLVRFSSSYEMRITTAFLMAVVGVIGLMRAKVRQHRGNIVRH